MVDVEFVYENGPVTFLEVTPDRVMWIFVHLGCGLIITDFCMYCNKDCIKSAGSSWEFLLLWGLKTETQNV